MDAPKGKPAQSALGRTARGKLQGFGIGAGREGKEAGRSPTVFWVPTSAAPRGFALKGMGHWS
jgi:hypothetical protein